MKLGLLKLIAIKKLIIETKRFWNKFEVLKTHDKILNNFWHYLRAKVSWCQDYVTYLVFDGKGLALARRTVFFHTMLQPKNITVIPSGCWIDSGIKTDFL